MKQKKIGVIGTGNMGSAIVYSMAKNITDCSITVYDKSQEKINLIDSIVDNCSGAGKIEKVKSINFLAELSDTIIFAVKPQDIDTILNKEAKNFENKNVITIIAGKPIQLFAEKLQNKNICRFMPNIAALCGKSATGIAFNENADKNFINDATEIANSFGSSFIIPEKLMSAFTGLSGSGIAFVYQFIHALAMGGVTTGINYAQSLDIALSVAEGAINSIRKSGKNPAELITTVSSPAGTTIEGIKVLESNCFNSTVMGAVIAASKRSDEIEKINF
jgi:pyrroline-5-carboxylate reductase